MRRDHYLPKDDPGKVTWSSNFAAKMATHGPLTGFTVIELTGITEDAAYFAWEVAIRIAVAARPPADRTTLRRPSAGHWIGAMSPSDEPVAEQ